MKILLVTTHITANEHPAFLRNQTGFGYMVHDIAKFISKDASTNVDVFVANAMTPSMEIDGFHIIKRSWNSWIKGLNYKVFFDSIRFLIRYKLPWKRALRALYMYLSVGQIEKVITKYDIIHIHSCSELSNSVIKVCKRRNVPFLVTLHGLNSFEDSIRLPKALKKHEQDFLNEAAANCYPVSFISTGNMEAATAFTGYENVKSFSVICNGCNINRIKPIIDVRRVHGISSSSFVFVFVGNISPNKNQLQVARAWNLLSKENKQKSKVLFVGRYTEEDEVVRYIRENGLQDDLVLCGIQPKENVPSYYCAANSTILTSKAEGFGLSIVEGYVYGLPNVTFEDLPATKDLYSPDSMIVVAERTDAKLAEAMACVINLRFDADKIKHFSQKFSLEKMAANYINKYKQILNQ